MRKHKKHELLAPAGSYEIAKAVIAAGADAVYLAGQMFGARAYASNLTQDRLKDVIDYAHLYGCQIHMTVNTLLKNSEMQRDLYDYMEPLYAHGLDAVIVQDFGVFQFLHACFPDLKLHASTQISVTSAAGAAFLKKQGASRIVTAREISLQEIRAIKEQVDIEIETFIHGALCYCYSGQCLMSSLIGGRSGNRGRCAQPCRLSYRVTDDSGKCYKSKNPYPLSPKDLCAIDLLPQLCDAGVDSFKIEGRMKQLEYAAGVTAIYRKCLDRLEQNPDHWQVYPEEKEALLELGNRSGFTEGYYQKRNGFDMLSSRDSSHHSGKTDLKLPAEPPKIGVELNCRAKVGMPFLLTASAGGLTVSREGAVVQEAQKKPLTEEELRKRLGKTGGTPFASEQIRIVMDDHIFLPVSAVNESRRQVLEKLKNQILVSFRRENAGKRQEQKDDTFAGKPVFRVQIAEFSMLSAALDSKFPDEILLDFQDPSDWKLLQKAADRIHAAGKRAVYCFPYICRKETLDRILKEKSRLQAACFDSYLVRSYDSLGFALDVLHIPPEKVETDSGLYVFSVYSAAAFRNLGIRSFTISQELNCKELLHQAADGELLIYGRQPLMISAQCVYKNYDVCVKAVSRNRKKLFLESETFSQKKGKKAGSSGNDPGNRYPVKTECRDCYNVIYNNRILNLLDQPEQVSRLGFRMLRISFVDENKKEMQQILEQIGLLRQNSGTRNSSDAKKKRPDGVSEKAKKASDRDGLSAVYRQKYTHGHFHRGVE